MTGPSDELTAALHRLRGAVRDQVPVPPAATLRARATQRQRVRRTATAVLVATAVAALAIGGAQAIGLVAGPPLPPAETPTPAPSATGPMPSASPSPSASPQPPSVPAVTPSPRSAPLAPPEPPDDPITRVDWHTAAMTLPTSEYCPSGPVRFAPWSPSGSESDESTIARVHADGKVIWIIEEGLRGYGDVTGDGRLEVIVEVLCFLSADGTDLPSGHGGHFLAVARADDGTLTGLGWVGPRSANIQAVWVSDGRVLMTGDPWTAGPDDYFPALPGLALSYRWDGARFVGWEPAAEYPPIVPLDPADAGSPVQPRAVAAALGCPDGELRFSRSETEWGGAAAAGGATFMIPSRYQQQFLFDLDHTGQRLLVTALACTSPDGWTREGLAVFERAGDGWQGISVLTPPSGYGVVEAGAWGLGDDGELRVDWSRQVGGGQWETDPLSYRWTGTELVPAS